MMDTKRLTARKVSVSEIMGGKFVKKTGFESSYILTTLGRKLSRVRVLGLIVDKFISPDEKYAAVTLDDGSDTIRCKSFINIKIFDGMTAGDLVDVFGKVKEYNGEIYITPEIVRKPDVNLETLRILELEKLSVDQRLKVRKIQSIMKQTSDVNELKTAAKPFMSPDDAESIIEAHEILESDIEEKEHASIEKRDVILKLIQSLDIGDGVDYKQILDKSGLNENAVDLAVQELLESGACFEPKPGKIKKL